MQSTNEKLTDAILDLLGETYTVNGQPVQGQAISFLHSSLRDKGWRNLGGLGDFESLVESLGFRVVEGRNRRGGKARVVTI